MISHFEQIKHMNTNASVNIPNSIFRQLSRNIEPRTGGGKNSSRQISFAYNYLVAIAFLYKYSNFVDVGNKSYLQNSDLKELLGYSKTTKSVNRLIAKGGILESIGLVHTTKDYPVSHHFHKEDEINGMPVWEFLMWSEIDDEHILSDKLKAIVQNRNYEIREPLFLTESYDKNEYGTLYQFERTHEITISEFLRFLSDPTLSNSTFLLYAYFKYRCKGLPKNSCSIALYKIENETGIDATTFYDKLNQLKDSKFVSVLHGKWKPRQEDRYVPMIANQYFWKGV